MWKKKNNADFFQGQEVSNILSVVWAAQQLQFKLQHLLNKQLDFEGLTEMVNGERLCVYRLNNK